MVAKNRFYKLDKKPTYTRKEIDLRSEFDKTLDGSVYELSKSFLVLLRKFRRNENRYRIPCSCNVAKEGQSHHRCTVCLGEGFLWDEIYIDVFKNEVGSDDAKAGASLITEIGRTKKEFCKFYLKSNIEIDYEDRIIELRLDTEGNVIKPERRGLNWTINTLSYKRSDSGKLEYIVIYCRKY